MSQQSSNPEDRSQHTFSETWSDPLAQASTQQVRQYTDEARDPSYIPPRPREELKRRRLTAPMSAMETDDSYSVSTRETKFVFTGTNDEVKTLWFLVDNKAQLDTDVRDQDTAKVAYALSLFGGKALHWAAEAVEAEPALRSSYSLFQSKIKEVFGLPQLAQQNRDQTELMRLTCQPGKAADFANQFALLCQRNGIQDEAFRTLLFASKLPTALKEKVLVLQGSTEYSHIRDNAILIDSFSTPSSGPGPRRKRKKSSSLKCAKCGRTNHATKDCYAKTTVQ